jgi:5-aminolevulinate synthase
MDFNTYFQEQLDTCTRQLPRVCRARAACRRFDVTVWCSNDYLGMGQHPKVIAAMHAAIDRAARAPAAPATSPAPTTPRELERELADLHGKEAALIFTSGYVSNWASLGTLASKLPGASSIPTRSTTPR